MVIIIIILSPVSTPAEKVAIAAATNFGIGGSVQQFAWHYQGQTFAIAYEILGKGTPVLLLPAFSTVSTRAEMRGLAERLAPHFQVLAMDWLGFGQSARAQLGVSAIALPSAIAGFCE